MGDLNDIDIIAYKEFVKIYSNDSNLISLLGSVFHNEKSRAMWLLLSNTHKEFYLKEMAVLIEKTENPRLPIYEHHIKTMIKAGIVLVEQRMHNKHITKFYRAAPVILFTTPQLYGKATKSKTLKNAFFKVFKFAVIGIAATVSYGLLALNSIDHGSSWSVDPTSTSIDVPLAIIICGLLIVILHSLHKKSHSINIERSNLNSIQDKIKQ